MINNVNGWGFQGHETVAAIASKFLNSNAQSKSATLLPDGLVRAAVWADQIRENPAYTWTSTLHYVDTLDWQCKYNAQTDCRNNKCLVSAIYNYSTRLSKYDEASAEDLKFFIHFVGDLHQPMHIGFASDQGGNYQRGDFLTWRNYSLHSIWDISILRQYIENNFRNSQTKFTTWIIEQAQTDKTTRNEQYNTKAVLNWATDSAAAACDYGYTNADGSVIQNGFYLDNNYYNKAYPVIIDQLIKGGLRLANALNTIWPESAAVALEEA